MTITGTGFGWLGYATVTFSTSGGCGAIAPASAPLPLSGGGPVTTVFTAGSGIVVTCAQSITGSNSKLLVAGDTASTTVTVVPPPSISVGLPSGATKYAILPGSSYPTTPAITGVRISPTITIKPAFKGVYLIESEPGYRIRFISITLAVKSDVSAANATAVLSPSPATGVTTVDIAEPVTAAPQQSETITITSDTKDAAANATFKIFVGEDAAAPPAVFSSAPGPK